jgi:hypothetical protein
LGVEDDDDALGVDDDDAWNDVEDEMEAVDAIEAEIAMPDVRGRRRYLSWFCEHCTMLLQSGGSRGMNDMTVMKKNVTPPTYAFTSNAKYAPQGLQESSRRLAVTVSGAG